jgi:hypothetical protein
MIAESKAFGWKKLYQFTMFLLFFFFFFDGFVQIALKNVALSILSFAISIGGIILFVLTLLKPFAIISREEVYFHLTAVRTKKIKTETIRGISVQGNKVELLLADGAKVRVYLSMLEPLEKDSFIQALKSAIQTGNKNPT